MHCPGRKYKPLPCINCKSLNEYRKDKELRTNGLKKH